MCQVYSVSSVQCVWTGRRKVQLTAAQEWGLRALFLTILCCPLTSFTTLLSSLMFLLHHPLISAFMVTIPKPPLWSSHSPDISSESSFKLSWSPPPSWNHPSGHSTAKIGHHKLQHNFPETWFCCFLNFPISQAQMVRRVKAYLKSMKVPTKYKTRFSCWQRCWY